MGTNSAIEWTGDTWAKPSRGGHATAAARLGIDLCVYLARVASGEKYCWRCRCWRSVDAFGPDRSRFDGRAAVCMTCRRQPRQIPLIRRTAAEYERARYANDPTFRASRVQRSAARRRGVAVVPPAGVALLLDVFEGRCAYCPRPAQTWDHLVPVSKGGETRHGNVVPACKSCNSRKRDRDVAEFLIAEGIEISDALDSIFGMAGVRGLC